jgi:hypothetical protein
MFNIEGVTNKTPSKIKNWRVYKMSQKMLDFFRRIVAEDEKTFKEIFQLSDKELKEFKEKINKKSESV